MDQVLLPVLASASAWAYLVERHGQFGPLGPQQQRLSLLEVLLLQADLGLAHQNVGHAVGVVVLGHPLCVGPVFVVDVPG